MFEKDLETLLDTLERIDKSKLSGEIKDNLQECIFYLANPLKNKGDRLNKILGEDKEEDTHLEDYKAALRSDFGEFLQQQTGYTSEDARSYNDAVRLYNDIVDVHLRRTVISHGQLKKLSVLTKDALIDKEVERDPFNILASSCRGAEAVIGYAATRPSMLQRLHEVTQTKGTAHKFVHKLFELSEVLRNDKPYSWQEIEKLIDVTYSYMSMEKALKPDSTIDPSEIIEKCSMSIQKAVNVGRKKASTDDQEKCDGVSLAEERRELLDTLWLCSQRRKAREYTLNAIEEVNDLAQLLRNSSIDMSRINEVFEKIIPEEFSIETVGRIASAAKKFWQFSKQEECAGLGELVFEWMCYISEYCKELVPVDFLDKTCRAHLIHYSFTSAEKIKDECITEIIFDPHWLELYLQLSYTAEEPLREDTAGMKRPYGDLLDMHMWYWQKTSDYVVFLPSLVALRRIARKSGLAAQDMPVAASICDKLENIIYHTKPSAEKILGIVNSWNSHAGEYKYSDTIERFHLLEKICSTLCDIKDPEFALKIISQMTFYSAERLEQFANLDNPLEERLGLDTAHHVQLDEVKEKLLVFASALSESELVLNPVVSYRPCIGKQRTFSLPQTIFHYSTKEENSQLYRGIAAAELGKTLFGTLELSPTSKYLAGRQNAELGTILKDVFAEDSSLGYEVLSYVETKRVMERVKEKFPGLRKPVEKLQEYLLNSARHEWQKEVLSGKKIPALFEDSISFAEKIYKSLPKMKEQTKELPAKVVVVSKKQFETTAVAAEEAETSIEELAQYKYDEWDGMNWLKDNATVREINISAAPNDFVELQGKVDRLAIERTKKLFEQLKPPEYRRIRKQKEGNIDFKEIMAARAAAACGLTPSNRLYRQLRIEHRSVAALVLFEISGSLNKVIQETDSLDAVVANAQTALPGLEEEKKLQVEKLLIAAQRVNELRFGQEEKYALLVSRYAAQIKRLLNGGTPNIAINIVKRATYALCEAINIVGDGFAVYAYSGSGPERVEVFVVKRFDEPYIRDIIYKIGNLQPRAQNRDGPVIRHATKVLEDFSAKKKLLIYLSDGKPKDEKYKHAQEDTRRALQEPRSRGIIPFCIIAGKKPDAASELYTGISHVYIPKFEDLPKRVPEIYRRLAL